MKQVFVIACFLSSLHCFSQDIHDPVVKDPVADTSKPILFCGKGLETLVYSKKDKAFEKQFKVKYTIVDCVQEYPVEVMSSHNKTIAQFLDRKFGSIWRDGLRPDVFGVTD